MDNWLQIKDLKVKYDCLYEEFDVECSFGSEYVSEYVAASNPSLSGALLILFNTIEQAVKSKGGGA